MKLCRSGLLFFYEKWVAGDSLIVKCCRATLFTVEYCCCDNNARKMSTWNGIAATVLHRKCLRGMGSLRLFVEDGANRPVPLYLLDLYIYIKLKTLSASCRMLQGSLEGLYDIGICVSFYWHDWNRPNSGSLTNQPTKQTNSFAAKLHSK